MNYTSVEQSKHLVDLGLNPDSADMAYFKTGDNEYILDALLYNTSMDYDLPCWSVGALRSLIPVGLNFKDGTVLFKNHNREDGTWVYYFAYTTNDDMVKVQFTGSDLRAAYDMVCWLLENNYI